MTTELQKSDRMHEVRIQAIKSVEDEMLHFICHRTAYYSLTIEAAAHLARQAMIAASGAMDAVLTYDVEEDREDVEEDR